MTKAELLLMLKRALEEEEHAIPLYTKHLDSTLFLADFQPEARTRVKELLLLLKGDSEYHARVYNGLVKTVEGSDQDVY